MDIVKTFENVSKTSPLVHSITNYVTVNDCANILLAAKASPVMADEAEEVAQITAISQGLNINIGTLNKRTIESMHISAKTANENNIPITLDAVGAGASELRTDTARALAEKHKLTLIKGNISEIKALMGVSSETKGVDAAENDCLAGDDFSELAKECSRKTGAIIVITGQCDIVTDGSKTCKIFGGTPLMKSVTGTGCMLSAILCAFLASNKQNCFEAAVSAVCMMGLCGEKALSLMSENDANASFRNHLINSVYNFTAEDFKEARYEIN